MIALVPSSPARCSHCDISSGVSTAWERRQQQTRRRQADMNNASRRIGFHSHFAASVSIVLATSQRRRKHAGRELAAAAPAATHERSRSRRHPNRSPAGLPMRWRP